MKFFKTVVPLISAVVLGLSAVPVVSAAETGQDVYEDTRYSAVGFGSVADIVGILTAITDDISDPTEAEKIKDAFKNFASDFAEKYAENVVDEANKTWQTAPNYTIQSAFIIMGKRKLMYANGEYEVQTIYLYKDNNVIEATPQQFGQYTVAPNTILLVRATSWNGVIPVSFPLGDGNNIGLRTYNAANGSACDILFNAADNDTLVYDTPTGRETVGFRHGSNWSPRYISFLNNTVNSIVNNNLVAEYVNSQGNYNTYLPDYYCDNLEALLGTGYWYEGSQGFMTSVQDFYITSAFFNDTDEFGSSHINDYFTTDPANIDPSKPPAYILPDDNPLSGGQTINNNTINNYNDYGITDIDGQLSIDPDILAGALGALVDPDFMGALGGVFDAQPQIGLGFDTPLDLNLPELFDDFIDSLVVYPPSSGWEPPSYPAVNTSAFIPATYPTYSTVTIPQDLAQNMGKILTSGWDIFDSLGVLSFVVPIIIMLLLWRFTGK